MSNNSIHRSFQENAPLLNHTSQPQPVATRRFVDLKTGSSAPAPREQKLWQAIKHVIYKYLSNLNPISSSTHYILSKGALTSSVFYMNSAADKAVRKGKIQEFNRKDVDASLEKFTLEISNEWDVALDGATLKMKDPTTDEYLVVFQANGNHYEDSLTEARRLGQALNKNVVVFNYRGVGESTGSATSAKDLVNDGKAILTMLKNQGVDLDKVTLYGHSIGGGVASSVATQSNKVKVIVDRSFSSLSEATKEVVSKATWRVLGALAKHLFKSYNWELKTAKNLNSMSSERVLVFTNENDNTLKKSALSKKLNETIQQVEVSFSSMQRFGNVWKENVNHFQDCFKTLAEKQRTAESMIKSSSSESLSESSSDFDDYRGDLKNAINQLKDEIKKETPDINQLKEHFKEIRTLVEENETALKNLDLSSTRSKFPAFQRAFNALNDQFIELEKEGIKSKKPITATIEFDQHTTHLASDPVTIKIFKTAVNTHFGIPQSHPSQSHPSQSHPPQAQSDLLDDDDEDIFPKHQSGSSQAMGLGF